ncbi:unnamed protein product [Zymoseptoria tritici ST99CH_3D7]|uniref:Uncharacterized protein n=1 Tax=Zymoseptoria tritici (strain ST99CH_3D7) TaxID=1276538 RepID=A0A1X7RM68_ZYMT9|nr:unnamed protein product [Zymoseptoria tritici ST99CH_3D7]
MTYASIPSHHIRVEVAYELGQEDRLGGREGHTRRRRHLRRKPGRLRRRIRDQEIEQRRKAGYFFIPDGIHLRPEGLGRCHYCWDRRPLSLSSRSGRISPELFARHRHKRSRTWKVQLLLHAGREVVSVHLARRLMLVQQEFKGRSTSPERPRFPARFSRCTSTARSPQWGGIEDPTKLRRR